MRTPFPLLLAGFLAVSLVGGGIWWMLANHQISVLPAKPTLLGDPNVELRLSKPRIRVVDGGKIAWEVEADNFDLSKDRQVQRFKNLKRAIALNNGKEEMTLSAGTLERNTLTGNMSLTGEVILTASTFVVRTPMVTWDGQREILLLPQQLNAKLGGYIVTAPGGATYDVLRGTLTSQGSVTLTADGNIMHAGGVVFEALSQRVTLKDPVTVQMDVADVTEWAQGRELPEIPQIPVGVQQRYQKYLKTQQSAASPSRQPRFPWRRQTP